MRLYVCRQISQRNFDGEEIQIYKDFQVQVLEAIGSCLIHHQHLRCYFYKLFYSYMEY